MVTAIYRIWPIRSTAAKSLDIYTLYNPYLDEVIPQISYNEYLLHVKYVSQKINQDLTSNCQMYAHHEHMSDERDDDYSCDGCRIVRWGNDSASAGDPGYFSSGAGIGHGPQHPRQHLLSLRSRSDLMSIVIVAKR